MADRDVNIRVTEDASQAKTENAALAVSVGEVNAAVDASAASTSRNTEAIVVSQAEWNKLVKQGWEPALLAAAGYKVAEEGATAAIGLGTTARAELNNAENVLTFSRGRAIRAAIDEASATLGLKEAMVASAPAIVGLAAGLFAANSLLGAFKERGLDVSTVGDLLGRVVDALTEKLGGTSKQVESLNKKFEEQDARLAGLGDAAGTYGNAQQRLIATGGNYEKVLDNVTKSLQAQVVAEIGAGQRGEEFQAILRANGVTAEQVAPKLDQINKDLNVIANYDPSGARRFTEVLVSMGSDAGTSSEKIAGLQASIERAKKAYEDWVEAHKNDKALVGVWDEFALGVAKVTVETEKLKEAGADQNAVQQITKKQIDDTTVAAQALASRMSDLTAAQRKSVQEWLATHPLVNAAADDLRKYEDRVRSLSLSLRQHVIDLATDIAKIKEHADAATRASLTSLKETKIYLGEQEDAIRAAHERGETSDDEYNAALTKNADDYHAAVVKYSKDNAKNIQDEATQVQDAKDKQSKAIGEVEQKLSELGISQNKALEIAEKAYKGQAEAAKPLLALADDLATKAIPQVEGFQGNFQSVHDIIQKTASEAIPAFLKSCDGIGEKAGGEVKIVIGTVEELIRKLDLANIKFAALKANGGIGSSGTGAAGPGGGSPADAADGPNSTPPSDTPPGGAP
jgi:hypothetical protein